MWQNWKIDIEFVLVCSNMTLNNSYPWQPQRGRELPVSVSWGLGSRFFLLLSVWSDISQSTSSNNIMYFTFKYALYQSGHHIRHTEVECLNKISDNTDINEMYLLQRENQIPFNSVNEIFPLTWVLLNSHSVICILYFLKPWSHLSSVE